MKISNEGVELIKRHEGCRLTAYKCPAGILTIGYGHTGADVTAGMGINTQQADELLRKDLSSAERAVTTEGLRINQNQFDALVSFVYNIGAGAFRSSTLLKMIRINPLSLNIRTEFAKWCKAKGTTLPGLALRRKQEAELYFSK